LVRWFRTNYPVAIDVAGLVAETRRIHKNLRTRRMRSTQPSITHVLGSAVAVGAPLAFGFFKDAGLDPTSGRV